MSNLDEFVSALERTLELLRNSRNGNAEWIQDVISRVETPLDYYRTNGRFPFLGKSKLRQLLLPSVDLDKSEIEEIAELNGWLEEYLEIAKISDDYLNWFPSIL